MRRGVLFILAMVAFSCAAQSAFSQANINEGLETAYLYVNGTTGKDSNPGTESSPLQTIGKAATLAATNNQNGIGTRVTIDAGTYRESVSLDYNKKNTNLPITFEAASGANVIVSGSTVYSGWSEYSANKSIYTHSWTYKWGECAQLKSCPYQQNIMMRQELVAVNGTVLTEVMSLTQMLAGTFYVDETSETMYVWPPSGTTMSSATVEAATSSSLWTISGDSYIVVRGITFQYANSCRASAAVQVQGNSDNILFDSDTFQWNNGQGFSVSNPVTYFTVENSIAQYNGDSGFQESETQYGSWQSDTSSYNNWRGAQGAYYVCNTAGFHGWEAHDDTIDGLNLTFNQSYGVHWDTDNVNISTSGVNSTGNLMSGVFVEKDPGPVTLSDASICNQTSALAVGGLVLRNSEGVSLTDSVVMDNAAAEIILIGVKGGIEVTDWLTGETENLVTENFTNTSNTIQGNSSGQLVFKDSYLNDSDWTSFQTTLVSSGNTWWNADNSSTPYTVPTPKTGSQDDFSGWQGATDADSTSKWKAPKSSAGNACNLTPSGPDFWISINSPLLTVSPKDSVTYNLTVTPLNFTGTVSLSLDGISEVSGLSATLSPSSIKTSGTSVLTVTAGKSTAPGTYSIVVLANSGNTTHTVTTQLTVN